MIETVQATAAVSPVQLQSRPEAPVCESYGSPASYAKDSLQLAQDAKQGFFKRVTQPIYDFSDRLGIDGRFVTGGIVAGQAAKSVTHWVPAIKTLVTMQRQVGIRTFIREQGVRQFGRTMGCAVGKGIALGWVAFGVALAGSLAIGAAAHAGVFNAVVGLKPIKNPS